MPDNRSPEPVMEPRQPAGGPAAQPVMQSRVAQTCDDDPVMELREDEGEQTVPVMESRRPDEGGAPRGVMESNAAAQRDQAKPVMESRQRSTRN